MRYRRLEMCAGDVEILYVRSDAGIVAIGRDEMVVGSSFGIRPLFRQLEKGRLTKTLAREIRSRSGVGPLPAISADQLRPLGATYF